uniref:fimbrial protein n=1 Tax=Halomonas sp. TaxID=1486246 RepID=UPI002616123E|nr:fimbrial protein [Halomonas sp.]
MKKFVVSTLAGVTLAAATGAMAADGTITINGLVVDSACNIAIDGGAADATVVLPTVSSSSLAAAGDTAGNTAISMSLSGCPTSGAVRAWFEPTNVDMNTGNLLNNAATPAENVLVQVTDQASGNVIDLRDNTNNPFVNFATDGSATLNYAAQYYATDAATSGNVETQLVYTLDYQ